MQKSNLISPGDHTVHIRVSAHLFEKLKSFAYSDERSVSGLIKYIVIQYLKKHKGT
jgi:hypothetical protein